MSKQKQLRLLMAELLASGDDAMLAEAELIEARNRGDEMMNRVRMAVVDRVDAWRPNPDVYTPSGEGWRKRVQMWALRFARYLGASNQEAYADFRTIDVDVADIMDACRDQVYRMQEAGQEPEMILMSPHDEWELQAAISFDMPYSSAAQAHYQQDGKRYTFSLAGVRVVVNPWQVGTVIVPKVRG